MNITGGSSQCSAATCMGAMGWGDPRERGYKWVTHFVVQQKLTQHHKVTVPQ